MYERFLLQATTIIKPYNPVHYYLVVTGKYSSKIMHLTKQAQRYAEKNYSRLHQMNSAMIEVDFTVPWKQWRDEFYQHELIPKHVQVFSITVDRKQVPYNCDAQSVAQAFYLRNVRSVLCRLTKNQLKQKSFEVDNGHGDEKYAREAGKPSEAARCCRYKVAPKFGTSMATLIQERSNPQ